MNPHNTLEKMRAMRLKTMAELYQQSLSNNMYGQLSLDEVMASLIDAEWEDRQQRKIAALIKRAGFRQQAAATDIDYHPDRGLFKNTWPGAISVLVSAHRGLQLDPRLAKQIQLTLSG